jgi:DNA-binding CsgD family transcriptional regulator
MELSRKIPPPPSFLWAVIVCCSIWVQLSGFSPAFTVTEHLLPILDIDRISFFLSTGLGFFGFMLFDKSALRHNRLLLFLIPLLLFIGTLFFALAGRQALIPQQLLALFGGLLMGPCYAWVTLSLYHAFQFNGSLWGLTLLLVFAKVSANILLFLIFSFISQNFQFIITLTVVPLTGMLLWRISKRLVFKTQVLASHRNGGRRSSSSIRDQVILLLVVTFSMVIIRAVNTGGIWGGAQTTVSEIPSALAILLSAVLFAPLSLAVFFGYTHRSGQRWLQLPFIVMIALLFCLQFLSNNLVSASLREGFSLAVENYCHLLFSITLIGCIRSVPFSAFRVSGFCLGLLQVFILFWMLFFEGIDLRISLIVLTAIYLMALFISSSSQGREAQQRSSSRLRAEAENGEIEDAVGFDAELGLRCAVLAENHDLTHKEADILLFLACGRSVSFIQQELVLAEGTVRTHVKHIYTKLNVHSRQELFDVLLHERG